MFRDVSTALETLAEAVLERLRSARSETEPLDDENAPRQDAMRSMPGSAESILSTSAIRSRFTRGRRWVAVLAAVLLVSAVVPPAVAGGGSFVDVDGSTHEANIDLVAEAGITLGCGEGLFCPDDAVTRAQMASFVVRALGYVDDGGGDLFTDDDGSTHEANIDLLAAAGVTLGCGDGVFCPGDAVTRGQMASFIARAFHYDVASAEADHFSDDGGSTHEGNINLLFEAGVTQGCSADGLSFCPGDPVTRGQMASFLARALKLPWPTDHSDHPDLAPELNDQLGDAVAVGDFNGDGWDDIAAGLRGENGNAGAVRIVYGTAGGPTGTTQFFTDTDFGVDPQGFAVLGETLAVGDFDDDGYDDLAIGANDPAAGDVGRVVLARGGTDGLTPDGEIFRGVMDDFTVKAMAAGQFGSGPADDLAIGIDVRDVGGVESAGVVEVMYGSAGGFSAPVQFHQNVAGVLGVVEKSDRFGQHLAAGDLTGDGLDELVIGVPAEDLLIEGTNVVDVGVLHVFYGSEGGLLVDGGTSPQLIHQEDVGGVIEQGDRFGSSVVVGDFTGDGIGDLIVGASGEDLESPVVVVSRGNVHIIPGSANGPVGAMAFDLDAIAGTNQPLEGDFLGTNLGFVRGEQPFVVVPRSTDDLAAMAYLLRPDRLDTLETPLFDSQMSDALSAVDAGDINGDGRLDLVIGVSWLPLPDGTSVGGVAVWLGEADGALEPWAGGLIQ